MAVGTSIESSELAGRRFPFSTLSRCTAIIFAGHIWGPLYAISRDYIGEDYFD